MGLHGHGFCTGPEAFTMPHAELSTCGQVVELLDAEVRRAKLDGLVLEVRSLSYTCHCLV